MGAGLLVSGFRVLIVAMTLFAATGILAQKATSPKTVFRDSNGNLISNNEFVDLRIANPREKKDPATKTVLEDGTIEFRLGPVPQEGSLAPVFNAPILGGKTLTADYLRGKVVVLNFWFIGCPGCLTEIPKLNALAAKFNENSDVVFIAVAPDSPQALQQFLAHERFDYQMVGGGRVIINEFAFAGFPRNIVIGKDGRIAYWRSTVYAWEKFESVIRAELDK
jgi:peroxiredoxin